VCIGAAGSVLLGIVLSSWLTWKGAFRAAFQSFVGDGSAVTVALTSSPHNFARLDSSQSFQVAFFGRKIFSRTPFDNFFKTSLASTINPQLMNGSC
jgi:hypothetical protein